MAHSLDSLRATWKRAIIPNGIVQFMIIENLVISIFWRDLTVLRSGEDNSVDKARILISLWS